MIYLRVTQAFVIVPVMNLVFIAIASESYGTKKDTFFSWFGVNITGGSYNVTSPPVGWVSDKKKLMWKDLGAEDIPANNYTLFAALAKFGFDSNY